MVAKGSRSMSRPKSSSFTLPSRRPLGGGSGEVGRKNLLGLVQRLDLEQPLAELGRARHALGVPPEVLAELERGLAVVPLEPEREPRVLERRREPLLG